MFIMLEIVENILYSTKCITYFFCIKFKQKLITINTIVLFINKVCYITFKICYNIFFPLSDTINVNTNISRQ